MMQIMALDVTQVPFDLYVGATARQQVVNLVRVRRILGVHAWHLMHCQRIPLLQQHLADCGFGRRSLLTH